jgi:heme/copper-type cytochrome/quinol oxidase subunit 3
MAATAEQLALPSGERQADPNVVVYGVLALSVASVAVMGTLVGAYLAIRAGTPVWPPKGVVLQEYYSNILGGTALIGGFGGWWAVYAVRRDEPRQATVALAMTAFMEGALINLMTYVIRSSALSPRTDAYGVLYYAFNIAVIAIAAAGIGVSIVALLRVAGGQVTSRQPAVAWAAAWYGTVVTLAFLIMYFFIYELQ